MDIGRSHPRYVPVVYEATGDGKNADPELRAAVRACAPNQLAARDASAASGADDAMDGGAALGTASGSASTSTSASASRAGSLGGDRGVENIREGGRLIIQVLHSRPPFIKYVSTLQVCDVCSEVGPAAGRDTALGMENLPRRISLWRSLRLLARKGTVPVSIA